MNRFLPTLFLSIMSMTTLFAVPQTVVYRNNLKGREFGKEAAQIFVSGARDIAGGKDRSEDQKYAAKLTQPKTDSSGCFGIFDFGGVLNEPVNEMKMNLKYKEQL